MSALTIRQSLTAVMAACRVGRAILHWRASRRRAAALARAESLREMAEEWERDFNDNEMLRVRGRHNYREMTR